MNEIATGKEKKGNVKISYLKAFDIYIIDYAVIITLEIGLSNMKIIENKIRKLSLNKDCIKILFDVRNTIWKDRETHNVLSKIGRRIFNPENFDFVIYTAVLNNDYDGLTFENEHWFFQKEDAIKWLAKKT